MTSYSCEQAVLGAEPGSSLLCSARHNPELGGPEMGRVEPSIRVETTKKKCVWDPKTTYVRGQAISPQGTEEISQSPTSESRDLFSPWH